MKRIAVFCGSRSGARAGYVDATVALARALARRGIGVVYGGGRVGLMGVLADAALAEGAEVIGVIPRRLMDKELGHGGCTRLHVVHTMHERKALMSDLAEGFIALPGGFGTLDEFFEILTWSQLGLHGKPCGVLNAAGYFDALLAWLDHARDEAFLRPQHRGLVLCEADADALLDAMAGFAPPPEPHWIERADV